MSYKPPTPPVDLSTEFVNSFNESSPDRLQDIACYAEALAESKERKARLEEKSNEVDVEERPDDVSAKATTTIKEINDNRYYYW